jgi:uncharacterized membrane protein required for colicin V production
MRYLGLVLAFVAAVVSVLVGRLLGLSREATVTLGMALTGFALFPFMKAFTPKLKFSLWALTTVIGTAVAGVLFYVFR